MGKSQALTSVIVLVIAIFASQSDAWWDELTFDELLELKKDMSIKAIDLTYDELLGKEDMSIKAIDEAISFVSENRYMQSKKLAFGPPGQRDLTVFIMSQMRQNTEGACSSYLLLNFDGYLEQAEEHPNIKKYLKYLYEPKLKQCEGALMFGLNKFKEIQPREWNHLERSYSAIKSNDQLYADLREDGNVMKKEMLGVLGDALKDASSKAEDDNQGKALKILQRACGKLLDGLMKKFEVVSRLSPRIEEEGELTEYIRYYRLCKMAQSQS